MPIWKVRLWLWIALYNSCVACPLHVLSCLVLWWIHVVKLSCGRDLPWICSPRFTKRLTSPDPASWWMLRHLADSGISSQQRPPGSRWCRSHNHQPDTSNLALSRNNFLSIIGKKQQVTFEIALHWFLSLFIIWECVLPVCTLYLSIYFLRCRATESFLLKNFHISLRNFKTR